MPVLLDGELNSASTNIGTFPGDIYGLKVMQHEGNNNDYGKKLDELFKQEKS